MAATSPQLLLAQANCYACFGAVSSVQMMRLSLLSRILLNVKPVAATDPQSLLAYAKCFSCFSNASMGDMMELALLDQISQNIGGGVAGPNLFGIGSPEGVETAPVGTIYFDFTTAGAPGVWVKETGVGNTGWVNFIAAGP